MLGSCTLSAETKRNTQLNESLIHHGHHHHHYYHQNPSVGSPAQSCSHHHHPYHHRSAAASSSLTNSGPSGLGSPLSRAGHGLRRREKSPSDLEADDENDHDSLNQVRCTYDLCLPTCAVVLLLPCVSRSPAQTSPAQTTSRAWHPRLTNIFSSFPNKIPAMLPRLNLQRENERMLIRLVSDLQKTIEMFEKLVLVYFPSL